MPTEKQVGLVELVYGGPYPVVSTDPLAQARYEAMRATGQSHRFAEMAALRVFPGVMTDSVFLEGHCNGSQFAGQEKIGDHYRKIAEDAGQDVKGKVYISGLAQFPGDPRAWVDGRGDVKRLCEERNWSCDGAVSHDAPVLPAKEVGLDTQLVTKEVDQLMKQYPEMKREEVAEDVWNMRKPHWVRESVPDEVIHASGQPDNVQG